MYTIVIADDEEELRKAIIRRVDWESIGFMVVGEAENGIEALEMVEREEPDLLLTDIKMPFVSGIELARQVREIRPTTQIAFLSGFDDFSYAQQAIQYNIISYLLKPITMAELTEELLTIKGKLDRLFEEFHARSCAEINEYSFVVPLMLDGYHTDSGDEREEWLQDMAVECGLLRNRNNAFEYAVMTAQVRDREGGNRTIPDSVHAVNLILRKYVKYYSFYMDGRVVSLLIATKATFERYLHILVGDIVQSMERILDYYCDVGLSRIVGKISEWHEAYHDAMNALSYSPQKESSVHYIADVERGMAFDFSRIPDLVGELENVLRSGSRQEVSDFLDKLFGQIRGEANSKLKVRFVLIQLSGALFRTVYAVLDNEGLNEIQDSETVQRFSLLDGSFQEMTDAFTRLCLSACEMIRKGRRKSGEILCEQTIQIIERDYADPNLSLVGVSSQINVSPNYLSALIRRHSGSSFIDLLTCKRIETAREMLLCTPMKIREISEKCGYSDQHYFSYCFKKYCGISPNAMRQQATEK